MKKKELLKMTPKSWDTISFDNRELLDEYFEKYEKTLSKFDPEWQEFFETPITVKEKGVFTQGKTEKVSLEEVSLVEKIGQLRIEGLIEAFRMWGHLEADVFPKGIKHPSTSKELQNALNKFHPSEMQTAFPTCGILPSKVASLEKIISSLKDIYCKRIGLEFVPFCAKEVQETIVNAFEPQGGHPPLTLEQKQIILHLLNSAEVFETFLHTKYVGQKRFSLEGAETLIPMLQALITNGSENGIDEVVIGMPHRGRLNVLSNIFNKSHQDTFAEFEDVHQKQQERSGDVKYHKGFTSTVQTKSGITVKLLMPANPSHLESIDPVVEGIVRARLTNKNGEKNTSVLPILIHGDAAIAGQGVVYETLQMSRLEAYQTGGTIHLIINNHIGFTTLPVDARSTFYCTDIAKPFGAPIFHVNAEDPEMCVWATTCALMLRNRFKCDVFIDLNCWRKWGHNESDEPAFTQPLVYQIIRQKPTIRKLYHDALMQEGVVEKEVAEQQEAEFRDLLQKAFVEVKEQAQESKTIIDDEKQPRKKIQQKELKTTLQELEEIVKIVSRASVNFDLHPRLKTVFAERLKILAEKKGDFKIDWGLAESLAFGTLLSKGISIRLAGQDTRRGTFSQRHAMIVCQSSGETFYPLNSLCKDSSFELWDSLLSEYAALGFEYGYSLAAPQSLVLWEAQFGDFANGAQVIIDQYISSGYQKWKAESSLCLLLPHGYEGQGPEHSSGRIERFLSLCAQNNMIVAYPTEPVQLFHLIRRQALNRENPSPLIVFTPKGLLRLPESFSTLQECVSKKFEEIISDENREAKKIIICTGHIYYDLLAEKNKRLMKDVSIIRIEQLYPFNQALLQKLLSSYPHAKEFFWVQEEPQNMGAWSYIRPLFQEVLGSKGEIQYKGRLASASPAVGSHIVHHHELVAIFDAVFK